MASATCAERCSSTALRDTNTYPRKGCFEHVPRHHLNESTPSACKCIPVGVRPTPQRPRGCHQRRTSREAGRCNNNGTTQLELSQEGSSKALCSLRRMAQSQKVTARNGTREQSGTMQAGEQAKAQRIRATQPGAKCCSCHRRCSTTSFIAQPVRQATRAGLRVFPPPTFASSVNRSIIPSISRPQRTNERRQERKGRKGSQAEEEFERGRAKRFQLLYVRTYHQNRRTNE